MSRLILKIIPYLFVFLEFILIKFIYIKLIFMGTYLHKNGYNNHFETLMVIIIAFSLLLIRMFCLNFKWNHKIFLLLILNEYFFYVFKHAGKGHYAEQFFYFLLLNGGLYYFDYYCLEFLKSLSKKDENN